MAVLRQFSNTGAYCLNGAGAIGRSRNKLLSRQMLARAKIAMPVTVFAHSPEDTNDLIVVAGRFGSGADRKRPATAKLRTAASLLTRSG